MKSNHSPPGNAVHEAEWLTVHPTIDATRVLEVSVYCGHRIATLELAGGRGTVTADSSQWHRLPSELQHELQDAFDVHMDRYVELRG